MDNEQPDPSAWFGVFKSVRLIFFFSLNSARHSLAAFAMGGLSSGSLPAQRGAIIPRYCGVRVQAQGPVVS